MCYSTSKSCSYWKSKTLCCITDQENKFSHHLSINRHLTSVDLPKSLDVCGVEISVQLKAQCYGILHCTINNTKSKLENLIFHNYNESTGFLLWLIDSSSEQESDSNKNFGLSSSDGFSSSSTASSEDYSRTGHHKPATLSRKWEWKQNSEGVKGPMKT